MRQEWGDARVIKRYANRRFYDPSLSRNVTLEEIAGFVRHGEDVRVVDGDSGQDLTRRILLQIILEEPTHKWLNLMPVQFLRWTIAARDTALTEWLESNLASLGDWMGRQMGPHPVSEAAQEAVENLLRAPWPGMSLADFGRAPKQPPEPKRAEKRTEAAARDDVDVRDELAELQKRLADLATKVKRKS